MEETKTTPKKPPIAGCIILIVVFLIIVFAIYSVIPKGSTAASKEQTTKDLQSEWSKVKAITDPADVAYSHINDEIQGSANGTNNIDTAQLYDDIKNEANDQNNTSLALVSLSENVPSSLDSYDISNAIETIDAAYSFRSEGLNDIADYLNTSDLSKQSDAKDKFNSYQTALLQGIAKFEDAGKKLGVEIK